MRVADTVLTLIVAVLLIGTVVYGVLRLYT
jgi:hypothetical protein